MGLQYSNKLRQWFPGKWDWSSIVLEEPLSVSSKYQEDAGLQMPEPYYDHRAFSNGGGASTPIYHPDQHHILQTQILGFRQTRGLLVITDTHLIVNKVNT